MFVRHTHSTCSTLTIGSRQREGEKCPVLKAICVLKAISSSFMQKICQSTQISSEETGGSMTKMHYGGQCSCNSVFTECWGVKPSWTTGYNLQDLNVQTCRA